MFRVTLFQDHQQRFAGKAAQVVLPAEAGEMTVLECHAPTLCTLSAGVVDIDGVLFPVQHGLAQIEGRAVTIVVH